MSRSHWIGLVVALALVVVLAWAYAGPGFDELVLAVDQLRQLGPLGGAVFVVVYAVCCAALVPATPFPLTAGFLWGPFFGLLVTWLGEVSGALLGFALGRTLLRERAATLASRYRVFSALETAIERGGFRLLVLVRLSPIFPFGVLNMALGLTKVPASHYALSTAMGVLPATSVLVYAGASLTTLTAALAGEAELGWGETLLTWGGLVVTAGIVGYISRTTTKVLRAEVPPPPPSP